MLALAWSPDGGTLAWASGSGVIQLTSTSESAMLENARRIVGRNLTSDEWRLHVSDRKTYRKTFPDLP